jgi:hypothetical protein
MAYARKTTGVDKFKPKPGEHWVEVTHGGNGYFAVEVWLNDQDYPGLPFVEPYNTGVGRYTIHHEAAEEAVMMADELGLPCWLGASTWIILAEKGLIA